VNVNETITDLAATGTGYVYTAEDGTQANITPSNFISTDAGQSLTAGTDGGLFVNVIGMVPSDTFSGSNNGTVDVTIVPDINDPNTYTVEGNLKVAATTPSNETNLLQWSASGFYVGANDVAAAVASDSSALAALVAAAPAASDTVQGKVSLAVAANASSTSDTEAATPAFVNAAIAAALAAQVDPFGL
jgi:hypothetical protein